MASQPPQPWPLPVDMAPQRPTWRLALRADTMNGWATTPQASECIWEGCWGCVWPSKHSFVPAMMNCHNIGVFWGPYTPSTASKIISACSGGYPPSIRHVGAKHKVSCGVLGGHFRQQRPWLAMVVLVDVGCWRLTSDQPTVGIVKIVYSSIFLFLSRSHTFLTSDPAAK
jgi:hypothetical protein